MREGTLRRIVAIGGLLVLMAMLRSTVFVQLRLFDAVPELVLLVVLAIAMTHGPEQAAMLGFVGGLLQDLTNPVAPVGLSCLSFVLVGFAFGVTQSYVIRPGRLLPIFSAWAATFAAGLVTILVGAVVGREYLFSGYQVRVAFWASCYSALVFPGVLLLGRRVMEAAQLDSVSAH